MLCSQESPTSNNSKGVKWRVVQEYRKRKHNISESNFSLMLNVLIQVSLQLKRTTMLSELPNKNKLVFQKTISLSLNLDNGERINDSFLNSYNEKESEQILNKVLECTIISFDGLYTVHKGNYDGHYLDVKNQVISIALKLTNEIVKVKF